MSQGPAAELSQCPQCSLPRASAPLTDHPGLASDKGRQYGEREAWGNLPLPLPSSSSSPLLFPVPLDHQPVTVMALWPAASMRQFSSVTQSCPTLCYPMDCSMPGIPVHHQLSELAQTHVHQVGGTIQPSHHLSSSSAFNISQHQGLF